MKISVGDSRANEHHTLTVMHTLWMREHNRVAELLEKQHQDWTDEKLFQEARRIVIAEYQHIIYKEWLPLILGVEYMRNNDLTPLSSGYVKRYLNHLSLGGEFDPRITNEFATAGFRFGHSLIPSKFKNMENPRQSKSFKFQDLRSVFNKPRPFAEDKSTYLTIFPQFFLRLSLPYPNFACFSLKTNTRIGHIM